MNLRGWEYRVIFWWFEENIVYEFGREEMGEGLVRIGKENIGNDGFDGNEYCR